jgi:hypothetical protein
MRSGASGSAQHFFGAFLCDVRVLAPSEKRYTASFFLDLLVKHHIATLLLYPSEKQHTVAELLDPLVKHYTAAELLDPSEKRHTVAELRASALAARLLVSFASQ